MDYGLEYVNDKYQKTQTLFSEYEIEHYDSNHIIALECYQVLGI